MERRLVLIVVTLVIAFVLNLLFARAAPTELDPGGGFEALTGADDRESER